MGLNDYPNLFLNFCQVGLGFGKWDFILEYQGIWTGRSHIGGGSSPESWQLDGLAKILAR